MKVRNMLRWLLWVIWVIVMILIAAPLLGQEEIHHIVADKDGNIYVSGTASGFFDEWSFVAAFSPEGKKNWYRVMTGELALSKDGEAVLFHGAKSGVVDVSKTSPDRGVMKKTTLRLPKNSEVADFYLASNGTIQVLILKKTHEKIQYHRLSMMQTEYYLETKRLGRLILTN